MAAQAIRISETRQSFGFTLIVIKKHISLNVSELFDIFFEYQYNILLWKFVEICRIDRYFPNF